MQVTSEGPPVTRVKVSQCVVCFKVLDNSTTFQCSRCHSGKYCSRGCQKDDWENHKVLCSAITQLNDQNREKTVNQITKLVLMTMIKNNYHNSDNDYNECPNV